METIKVNKIWLTDTAVWIQTDDNKKAHEKFADYQRLKFATPEQRANFTADDFGIHWADIDEDLSFEGFFIEKERTFLYKVFTSFPEINASAVARRLGMKQSLLASYISGAKKPSKERETQIINCMKQIGKELCELELV